jgi:hypothetical protein
VKGAGSTTLIDASSELRTKIGRDAAGGCGTAAAGFDAASGGAEGGCAAAAWSSRQAMAGDRACQVVRPGRTGTVKNIGEGHRQGNGAF